MGDGIFELRYRYGTDRFRLLFIHWGPHLVALTAFQKKQAKTPSPSSTRLGPGRSAGAGSSVRGPLGARPYLQRS